jgi:hypothetical protein
MVRNIFKVALVSSILYIVSGCKSTSGGHCDAYGSVENKEKPKTTI